MRLEWVNPHTWIHIETVKDGKPEIWMVEGGTPNTLLRRGITRDTVAIGTEVIVDGYQTKDHSLKRANGRDVTFTDGRKLFMGSSGTGAPQDGSDPTEGGTKPPAEEARRPLGLTEKPIQRPLAATVTHSAIDSAPTSIWRRAVLRTASLRVTRVRIVNVNAIAIASVYIFTQNAGL